MPIEGDAAALAVHGDPRTLLSQDAVELLATKPRYAVRVFVYLLVPLFVSVILWSALSRVDVVIVCDSVLVAEGDVLKVRAPMAGVVKELKVKEGETVEKGAALYELVSREAANEVAAIDRSKQALAQADEALTKEFPEKKDLAEKRSLHLKERLGYLEQLDAKNRELADRARAETDDVVAGKNLELKTIRGRLADATTEITTRDAALARQQDALAKSEKLLAAGLASEQATNAARDRFEEAQLGLKRAKQERTALEAQVETLELEVTRARNGLTLRLAEIDKDTIQNHAAAAGLSAELEQIRAELSSEESALKAKLDTARLDYESSRLVAFQGVSGDSVVIVSPTSGIVTQTLVKHPGELVASGDLILTLRPQGARLVAQARVQNKDIGHVQVGQVARIKYDAFPFVDYGIKTGCVATVPPDATQDPQLGPVFLVTIVPDESTIRVNGKDQPLAFGLKATVEVVTERRSVLSFFIEPFKDLGADSGSIPR
jgi:HlyD family secretion protein